MATNYGDLARQQIEAGLGVNPTDIPRGVVEGIDAFAKVVEAKANAAPSPAEAFEVLTGAISDYNNGQSKIEFQQLVDQNVAHAALAEYDADPTKTLSSVILAVPTPGGREKFRNQLVERHVGTFLAGTGDLSAYRTGTLDNEMLAGRIDGAMVTKVEESVNSEIDKRVASLEGKTPVEILATYNTTVNPDLKSRIGAKYADQISKARVSNRNSTFLQTTQNMAAYEAGLQAEIAGGNMTVEQANLARQELHAQMSQSVRDVVAQVTNGTMPLADARAYAATIPNPELSSRINAAVDALDTTGMDPGGTDARTAVADLLASPDLQNLGTGLQAVLTNEATTSLAVSDNLRQIATDEENLATMARNIEGNFANVEGNARIGYLLRKVGPVAVIVALCLFGAPFLPATLAIYPINTLILLAGGVAALHQYYAQGGIRPYLSQRLKEASTNLDIASQYTESGTKHRAEAATQDRVVVQDMMRANADFRSRRLPADVQPEVVQYFSRQLGGNIAPM